MPGLVPHPAHADQTRRLWQPPTGLQLFAWPEGKRQAAPADDIALAIASFLVLLIRRDLYRVATQLDEAVSELLASLPGFLDGIWRLVATSALMWVGLLLIISVRSRRTSPRPRPPVRRSHRRCRRRR